MANGLKHIQDNQLHESVFNEVSNTFTWGPLKIEYTVDLTIPQLTFSVFLAGIKIASGNVTTPRTPV